MNMDMQHGHGHAEWTWTCIMDTDMQHGQAHALVGYHGTVLSDSYNFFFTFAILPVCRPPMMVAMVFSSTFISNDI
jgi:hypothetical protein